jgi:deoxyxylulose-5-phosphate synthase
MVITVEDNFGGGIGSAVADACSNPAMASASADARQAHPQERRTPDEVLKMCGLTAKDIDMLGV